MDVRFVIGKVKLPSTVSFVEIEGRLVSTVRRDPVRGSAVCLGLGLGLGLKYHF